MRVIQMSREELERADTIPLEGESKDSQAFAPFDMEEDIFNLRTVLEAFDSFMQGVMLATFRDAMAALRRLPGHAELKESIEELIRSGESEHGVSLKAMLAIHDEINDVENMVIEDSGMDTDKLAEMTTDEDTEDSDWEDEEDDSPVAQTRRTLNFLKLRL
jgi:hypothetical protein